MSRTSCGQYLFEEEEKAAFISLLRKQAGFCGVDVLAYCMMGNHFHLLVSVPEKMELSDAELLRRYRLLYDSKHCPASSASPEVLSKLLEINDESGQSLRDRLLARMHDLPVFMRELKQRFGIWYNHRHQNHGTIWSKRYTSVVVEATREALTTVAAYIDLNPVRAELVVDPAEYRFSSYGNALVGNRLAQRGYVTVFGGELKWSELLADYNHILYGKGAMSKGALNKDRGRVSEATLSAVIDSKGVLPLSQVLRLRVRYFTAGTAIGSLGFLKQLSDEWKSRYGFERKKAGYPMRYGEWGGLQSFRNLQLSPVARSKPDL
jgi:REP element-mobilizing transposase RayT